MQKQYELKDQLKWKLELRNTHYFNIGLVGLKAVNLSRNSITDTFMNYLSGILNVDTYFKCLSLKHNNISDNGFQRIAKVAAEHPSLLSIDLRHNPGFQSPKA